MKILRTFPCFCALVMLSAVIPSAAQQDLYDNGPTDGLDSGLTINLTLSVSDSFTLSSNSTVNGLTFAAWLLPGDVLQTAEVAITSSEFGGTTYFDQTESFTESDCFSNGRANVCNETASFAGVAMNAGTYWLTLSSATVANGDPVYWDINGGPSMASQASVGTLPSESFTILGTNTGSGTTPEPSSLVLFGSGALGVAGLLRRRFPM